MLAFIGSGTVVLSNGVTPNSKTLAFAQINENNNQHFGYTIIKIFMLLYFQVPSTTFGFT